jgi:hypothetical protein
MGIVAGVSARIDDTDTRRYAPQQSSQYRIGSTVVGSAGSPGSSTNYTTNGTVGQSTPIGIGSAGGNTLRAGFWGWELIPTEADEIPGAFSLLQNFPNPFNPVTTIEFAVAGECPVDLAIFDVSGRKIKQLVHEERPPGRYREKWDGTNDRGARVATALYFYRLRAGSFVSVKKMVLIK